MVRQKKPVHRVQMTEGKTQTAMQPLSSSFDNASISQKYDRIVSVS